MIVSKGVGDIVIISLFLVAIICRKFTMNVIYRVVTCAV